MQVEAIMVAGIIALVYSLRIIVRENQTAKQRAKAAYKGRAM